MLVNGDFECSLAKSSFTQSSRALWIGLDLVPSLNHYVEYRLHTAHCTLHTASNPLSKGTRMSTAMLLCLFTEAACSGGEIYCQTSKTCMALSKICDGTFTCPDSKFNRSSVCTKCPENFCLNSGTCAVYENFGPNCSCPDSFSGYRCAISKSSPYTGSQDTSKTTIVASVVSAVIFVGIVLVVVYFVMKRRQNAENRKLTAGVENPVYDMQLGEVTTSAPFSEATMTDSSGIDNPLYGENLI